MQNFRHLYEDRFSLNLKLMKHIIEFWGRIKKRDMQAIIAASFVSFITNSTMKPKTYNLIAALSQAQHFQFWGRINKRDMQAIIVGWPHTEGKHILPIWNVNPPAESWQTKRKKDNDLAKTGNFGQKQQTSYKLSKVVLNIHFKDYRSISY